ncbi:MAG: hypothetical protein COX39_01640 [Candidatus Nealsonbacteria bacterium CG23_combo_of_CG06-09_8_20_14_all_40_13]|uniref:RCK N-terminal domain-containing protein n=1 Tax=Candidatus Nealsonbacteria bacterium CG23_combo_of_CG06-09_8_20_14_all_40_13 TaxID=1974724 RepID=A0A2G9YR34_9BACT|nr:MAG: hypothetical protein COX39_01640 [Candidatus Nealsonbacteria bacterium CG23_combo_of_CG06-09_8_20_14_all_40_13]PIR71170.1 MAG: hypothetical protein COU44_00920 [Candidatus Nealsonbacteria bacterium CG10_big_fil_rev_8_21_14_0_10_40_24]PIU43591.1 MAG: hypothetical protein COS97_00180 [Candidatus Nealsonbacteria bacterium CG07_land_8_20_14_0_80_40_10]
MRDFFSNTFFIVTIAISATIITLTYLISFRTRIWESFLRRKMEKEIASLKGHYILCGLGRVGHQIAAELMKAKVPFVVIDREDKSELCRKSKYLYINADAARDDGAFRQAEIAKAKAVIIAAGDDADCVFMAVAARSINPSINLIARASSHEGADKLRKLGVNKISMPHIIGGKHMADLALGKES